MHTSTVSLNQSGRDIVVGDVHGCFRTLERALGAERALGPAVARVRDALGAGAPLDAESAFALAGLVALAERIEPVAHRDRAPVFLSAFERAETHLAGLEVDVARAPRERLRYPAPGLGEREREGLDGALGCLSGHVRIWAGGAGYRGSVGAIRALLAAGAIRNARHVYGATALDIAMRAGRDDAADALRNA